MNTILEIGVATASSTAICASVTAEPLLTALITFGVSVVTIVGGEVIKLLVTWLQKKTKDIKCQDETEDKKDDVHK